MARRSTPMTPTQASQPPKDSTSPEPSQAPVVSLVGPPAEVPQPQPSEITIGAVPDRKPEQAPERAEVTVDEDGTITIN